MAANELVLWDFVVHGRRPHSGASGGSPSATLP
jgi:hypothetical protein